MGGGIGRRQALALLAAATALPARGAPEPRRVLMVLWRGETEADAAFRRELAVIAPDVALTTIDAGQSRGRLEAALAERRAEIRSGVFRAIYVFGTTATTIVQRTTPGLPIVFNSVFDPVRAEIVDGLRRPGGMTTGVSNMVSVADQLDACAKLAPVRRLMVIFNARELNADLAERQAQDWADQRGVAFLSRRLAPGTESFARLLGELQSGGPLPDTIYAGPDSYAITVAAELDAAVGGRIRLCGGGELFVRAGWLASYAPATDELGATAARMLTRVLDGALPAEIPVIVPPLRLFISAAAARRHGLVPPGDAILR